MIFIPKFAERTPKLKKLKQSFHFYIHFRLIKFNWTIKKP